jgi:hypothetical protein
MVYFLLNEFMAPANQIVQEETFPKINEDEQLGGLMAQLVLAKQATFDKPSKNQRDAIHYIPEAWHGPWRLNANKHNSK